MERSTAIYKSLVTLCQDNARYFQDETNKGGRRLHTTFIQILEQMHVATPICEHIASVAGDYDFDEATPGNGYRSYLVVMDACVLLVTDLCQQVQDKRAAIFFKTKTYTRKLESACRLLVSLTICLQELDKLLSLSKNGELYVSDEHSVEFLKTAETLDTLPFYGTHLGFQFCKSLRDILRHISIAMVTYSNWYGSNRNKVSKAAIFAWKASRHSWNDDLRAEKMAHISKYASIGFLKSFWTLSESDLFYRLPDLMCPTVAVNKIFTIPPEPLESVTNDGHTISIPIPSAHFDPAPINVHLFSSVERDGMGSNPTAGRSKYLMIHAHGGGFVAQSPRSHEIYLRDWAAQLKIPMLSIDYSLAPQAPFPRPLQEMVYAYCWALKNCHLLGSTAENVVFAGDSAGANLCLSLALKCIDLNLPLPKGMFLAYFPVLVSSAPSPSRVLTFMDPILPYGFLIGCLKAYACPSTEDTGDSTVIKNNGIHKLAETNEAREVEINGFNHETEVNGINDVKVNGAITEIVVNGVGKEIVVNGVGKEIDANGVETEIVVNGAEKEIVVNGVEKEIVVNGVEAEMVVNGVGKEIVVSTVEKEIVVNGVDKEIVVNGAEKEIVVNGVEAEMVVNGVGKEIVVSTVEKEIVVNGAEKEIVVNGVTKETDTNDHVNNDELIGSFKVIEIKPITTDSKDKKKEVNGSNNVKMQNGRAGTKESRKKSKVSPEVTSNKKRDLNLVTPNDPFLSPWWATDEVLKQLPPMSILSMELDPCLDDCVMFSRRIKNLGNKIKFDILPGLPHGFLYFAMMCEEAHAGSDLCVQRIKHLLELDDAEESRQSVKPKNKVT